MTERLRTLENPKEARYTSKKYQWLPTESAIDSDGPARPYSTIAGVFAKEYSNFWEDKFPGLDKHLRRQVDDMAYLERLENRSFVLPSPSSRFKPSSWEQIQARIKKPAFTLKGRTVQVVVNLSTTSSPPLDQTTVEASCVS
ncbi:BQ2448_7224 [Microbotryum intermedium]|uniref:BQ2448_7224 protein n=1 Tax=Microbotryum intermedium TaxID=269621 RepID=A0A238FQ21_9BASI|nr:BQ2448_7224 [Microbotryum intermedium]